VAPCQALCCDVVGAQSTLDPAGQEAGEIANLFWWMTGGGIVIWVAVVGLTIYANYCARRPWTVRLSKLLIIVGGVVTPTVLLAGLLVYGLAMLPPLLAPAPRGSLTILVSGEQWWWRVRYHPDSDHPIDVANEIHLPVGQPVEIQLESDNVIHSFWVPKLGGKMDMIPGRRTRIALRPTEQGTFRGVCAEYCGASHALMAFWVVVEDTQGFARWLARQAEPGAKPRLREAARGEELFLQNGCGACHTIRGTEADGVVGPDVTHVGSRLSVGAGLLGNDADAMSRWLAETDHLKPKVQMPAFGMLPPADLRALGAYLESLR
jgi:cytochrome c oxidase subunit II